DHPVSLPQARAAQGLGPPPRVLPGRLSLIDRPWGLKDALRHPAATVPQSGCHQVMLRLNLQGIQLPNIVDLGRLNPRISEPLRQLRILSHELLQKIRKPLRAPPW